MGQQWAAADHERHECSSLSSLSDPYTGEVTNAPPARLFRPGDGALPPALTGRGVQQGVLSRCLGLPDRLSAMDASFWSRLGKGLLPVGRLDDAAAREALVRPLADHHVVFDVDALDAVVEHSQRYPYFIQLWGDELWERRAGAARITTELAAAAGPAVVASVSDYYQTRYRELRAEGLLDAAVAVAPLFQDRADATAAEPELEAALAGAGDEADRFAALAKLNRMGFVWRPPGRTPPAAWSAGIPSLMTYVLEHAARR